MFGLGSLLITMGGAPPPAVVGVNYGIVDIAGGGQRVVVQVDSSSGCTGITIGGVACTSFAIDDGTHVSGVPGAHAAGVVDVVVASTKGLSTGGTGLVEYWSPAQLATGSADTFLDAAKSVTIATGVGNPVSAWASQGTTGRNFTQGTGANRPSQVASAFGTVPSIRFTPQQWLSTARSNFTAGLSLFAVAKWTSTDNTASNPVANAPLVILGDDTGNNYSNFGASAGSIVYIGHNGTSYVPTLRGSGLNNGAPHLVGAVHDQPAGQVRVYADGAQQGAATSLAFNAAYNGYTTVGARSGVDGFDGDIGALLVVQGVVSAPNMSRLLAWAKQRFGV